MTHERLVAIPPDGGWGWIIMAVSFVGLILIDVPAMGFQVVLYELENLFHKPASSISVIFSTYTLLLQLMGPIAGGICNRFGFKMTTITGCVMMIGGFIPLLFMDQYILYIVFFGVIAGIGSSFVILACTVAPGFWFEQKRAIALSVVSSATGFSLFSVSLCEVVSKHYGWRHVFSLWSLMVIFMALLSFLLKPPPMVEFDIRYPSTMENIPIHTPTATDVHKSKSKSSDIVGSLIPIAVSNTNELVAKKLSVILEETGLEMIPNPTGIPSRYMMHPPKKGCCGKIRKLCPKKIFGSRPLYRKDIFYHGNLDNAPELMHVPSTSYTLKLTKLPTIQDIREEVEGHFKMPEAVTRAVKEMIDFTLFKSWIFIMLIVATLFCYTAVYIPFLQLKRVNRGHMDDKYVNMLPIMMGIGLIVFRAAIGFILYYIPKIRALFVLVIASITAGLIFCIVPLSHKAPYQIILATFGGAFPSVINPLRSVVIIEYLGLDRLTSSVGILFFVQGIACFIGMPIAELLNEFTGQIYAGVIFSGVCYILTGISFAIIGMLTRMGSTPINTTSILSGM